MSWTFSDPADFPVLTTKPVLEGKEPILFVAHDIDDGTWQFHSGADFDESMACMASLGDIVQLDSGLDKIADLPIGMSAWRESPESEWIREPQHPSTWEELVAEAVEYTQAVQEDIKGEYELGTYEKWDHYLEDGAFEWSDAEDVVVHADMRVAGVYSNKDQTWHWGWESAEVPEASKEGLERLKAFGEHFGHGKLVESPQKAEEFDAWQLACVAALLLNAEYVHRTPTEEGFMFLILLDLDWDDEESEEDSNVG